MMAALICCSNTNGMPSKYDRSPLKLARLDSDPALANLLRLNPPPPYTTIKAEQHGDEQGWLIADDATGSSLCGPPQAIVVLFKSAGLNTPWNCWRADALSPKRQHSATDKLTRWALTAA